MFSKKNNNFSCVSTISFTFSFHSLFISELFLNCSVVFWRHVSFCFTFNWSSIDYGKFNILLIVTLLFSTKRQSVVFFPIELNFFFREKKKMVCQINSFHQIRLCSMIYVVRTKVHQRFIANCRLAILFLLFSFLIFATHEYSMWSFGECSNALMIWHSIILITIYRGCVVNNVENQRGELNELCVVIRAILRCYCL